MIAEIMVGRRNTWPESSDYVGRTVAAKAIIARPCPEPVSRPNDIRERINKPWRTTKREMESLNMLGLLRWVEESRFDYEGGKEKIVWRYRPADGFDPATLLAGAGGGEPPQAALG